LDFRSLGVWFLVRIFGLYFPPDDKLSHIIFLCQVEEFADFAGAFGTKTFGVSDIGEAREIIVALLYDHHGKNREIGTDDTSSNRFAFTFTGTTGTIARMALGKEKTNTSGMENTLRISEIDKKMGGYVLHGKSLLVISASDFEDVAFKFIAN
jgi:hypothetical protein